MVHHLSGLIIKLTNGGPRIPLAVNLHVSFGRDAKVGLFYFLSLPKEVEHSTQRIDV